MLDTPDLAIRKEVLFIIDQLRRAGFEAYLVGGAVRDLLSATDLVKDYDITTNATPEQIKTIFTESYYENEFGTVSVTHPDLLVQMGIAPELGQLPQKTQPSQRVVDAAKATKLHPSLTGQVQASSHQNAVFLADFEITTYRSKEVYANFRHPDPETLEWGSSIEEDLQRRDFTINAIAIGVQPEVLQEMWGQPIRSATDLITTLTPDQYLLVDPYQGIADLQRRLIATVGDPITRFKEDALRMLRAVRLAVQLDMQIDQKTLIAIRDHAELITEISWERIRDEFLKIISCQRPAEGIRLLDQTQLLHFILPELEITRDVEQGGHHTTDVWTHSLDALQACPSTDPIVRLSTLLHDIAKPTTFAQKDGQITFYNHEIVGSRMAVKIAKRLRLSKKDTERVFILVRYHMFHYQPHNTDAAIRRFMRKVGLQNIDAILDLREGDRLGSGARKTSWRLEEMKQRMIQQLHQPMDVTDLAINGHDLLRTFKLKPGPWIGQLLQQLLELVLDQPELNTPDQLLTTAQKMLSKQKSN